MYLYSISLANVLDTFTDTLRIWNHNVASLVNWSLILPIFVGLLLLVFLFMEDLHWEVQPATPLGWDIAFHSRVENK